MGSSARQHSEMRCGYRGKTSALPRRKITRRPADQTSAWTHPERRHKVESSAHGHRQGETARERQSGRDRQTDTDTDTDLRIRSPSKTRMNHQWANGGSCAHKLFHKNRDEAWAAVAASQ